MKSSILILVPVAVTIFAVVILQRVEAAPMDLYEDFSDDKLYDGVMDFLDTIGGEDDSSPRQGRRDSAERCRLPVRKGVCRALIPRWMYDSEAKDCKEFKFGGCDGNGNNFATYKQCMETCQEL